MNVFWLGLLTYMLFALLSPVLSELGLTLYAPDLSVALILATASRLGRNTFVLYALVVGLIMDAFTPLAPLGLHAERVVVVSYVAHVFLAMVPVRSSPGRIATGFGLSLVSDFILFVLLALFDRSFESYGLIFRRMLPHAMLTAVFIPVTDWLVDEVLRRVSKRKGSIFYS